MRNPPICIDHDLVIDRIRNKTIRFIYRDIRIHNVKAVIGRLLDGAVEVELMQQLFCPALIQIYLNIFCMYGTHQKFYKLSNI